MEYNKIIYESKKLTVLWSLAVIMTGISLLMLKFGGVEKTTLDMGYYIGLVVNSALLTYNKVPEKIVAW